MQAARWIRWIAVAGVLCMGGCAKHRISKSPHVLPADRMDADVAMPASHMSQIISSPPVLTTGAERWNREAYGLNDPTSFVSVWSHPLSTFSIDVDTASYSILRRMITQERRRGIPPGAIRIEELINYFHYDYPEPGPGHALAVDIESAACPWTPAHRLIRIGVQARTLDPLVRSPSNLVFLIDTSGSMNQASKLGLLKQSYGLLINQLDARDRVAVVTYAGSAGLALPSTTGENPRILQGAVDRLTAGGSTAGGAGIQLAYQTAREHFIPGGNNRVILATDGDFNVGVSSESELVDLIRDQAQSGVYLTVLGLGTGNYQDSRMEALSNHGNGNYAYIDGLDEARKVFLNDLMSTLYTVCKDVKIQAEFNPAYTASYRLIGYENRRLADGDFADDQKDAGDVGSGHQVTALYEVVPVTPETDPAATDPLRYQSPRQVINHPELMQVRIRYKMPDGEHSELLTQQVLPPASWTTGMTFSTASANMRFAASVAAFGMVLRHSPFRGQADLAWSLETAQGALGEDLHGYRAAFANLVEQAKDLRSAPAPHTIDRQPGANPPIPYTVLRGDTLEEIAQLFIVPLVEIRELNQLRPGEALFEGQTVLIPPSNL